MSASVFDFKVTISVVVHNNLALTKRCLASVFETCAGEDYELILTDNASTDGTWEYLSTLDRDAPITLVRNPENLGFIQPQIAAFARAKGAFFVTLNNDVELGGGWLAALLGAFEKDKNLAVAGAGGGCTTLGPDGIGYSGDVVDYVEGSCMMVRTDLQRKHGFFDNDLKFIYCDDSEICIRMRSLGYSIAKVDASVRHLGAATTKLVRKDGVDIEGYQMRNSHILRQKWQSFFERKRRGDVRSRVLIRRTGAQGDVLMATPALAAFRKAYPRVHVTVLTACPAVLAGNPDVDAVIEAMPNVKSFDRFFDLDMAYEKRPFVHPVVAYQDELEIECGGRAALMAVYPDVSARAVARQLLPEGSRYALLHPGMIPGWVGRQWSGEWAAVGEALRELGFRTVLIGNDESPRFPVDVEALNRPFAQLAALMERAGLFVGLDSMPFHVAQAVRIPAVGLFGCVDPALRLIGGRSVGVTARNVGCIGCHHWLSVPRTVTNACVRGDERCMKRLRPEDILSGVKRALALEKGGDV